MPEIGRNKYEIGVYREGRLIEVLRTDTEYMLGSLKVEAERIIQGLKKGEPDKEYIAKIITSPYYLKRDGLAGN